MRRLCKLLTHLCAILTLEHDKGEDKKQDICSDGQAMKLALLLV